MEFFYLNFRIHKKSRTNPKKERMEQELVCKRNGCRKKYLESKNTETSCKYHSGKPIFHDRKKGWTCCKITVYDWDEFEKIEGCTIANHTNIKETPKKGEEFYKSSTVATAKRAISNIPDGVKIRSIDDYNKEEEEKKKAEEEKLAAEKSKQPVVEKKPFITKNGKWRCTNKGCVKEYDHETEGENECKYHPGNPIFHDFKKSWSCCGATAYEFDAFLKLPTCAVGSHVPKMV